MYIKLTKCVERSLAQNAGSINLKNVFKFWLFLASISGILERRRCRFKQRISTLKKYTLLIDFLEFNNMEYVVACVQCPIWRIRSLARTWRSPACPGTGSTASTLGATAARAV